KGLINDQEFAKAWIDARRKSKQKGNIALKSELIKKGIDPQIINQLLNEESIDEKELAKEALSKKLKSWKNLTPLQFKQKAYSFLGRKGFNYQTSSEAINIVLKNTDELV